MTRLAFLVIAVSITSFACGPNRAVAPGQSSPDDDAGTTTDDGGEQPPEDAGPVIPDCVQNTECATSELCDQSTGTCVTQATGEIGSPCERNNDCRQGASATCLTSDLGFPSGYCAASCGTFGECEADSTCVSGIPPIQDVSVCVAMCTRSSDCRASYQCVPLGPALGVCMPPCTDASVCGDGQTCDKSQGKCVTRCTADSACPLGRVCDFGTKRCVDPAPDAGPAINAGTVQVTDLGTFNANGNVNVTAPTPANAVSSFFVAQSTGPQFNPDVELVYLRDPKNNVVYGAVFNDFFVPYNGDATCGVLYPNAPPKRTENNPDNLPGLTYEPDGDYVARFQSTPITAVNVTHITKSVTGTLNGGTIDVNLWFDSNEWDADSARSSSLFQNTLHDIRALWATIGVRMGEVHFLDLPDARHAHRNLAYSDVAKVVAMTGDAPNNGLNWVFVDSIDSDGDSTTTLGVSAGIPGVPLKGTGRSGVVVNLLTLQGGTASHTLTTTITHETGHWLGLFHTTEATGDHFDPLPDTPQCPVAGHDQNNDMQVSDTECADAGGTNLMFWLTDSTGQNPHTVITPDQQFVLLRNPALH